MANHKPADSRRHRANTDRTLLIGFFVVLLLAGGALIFWFDGGLAGVEGVICLLSLAGLAALVMLVVTELEKLSQWLDNRE